MTEQNRSAILLGLLAVLCWSTVATAFKVALSHQSLFQLLFVANMVTVAVLFPIVLWQKKVAELGQQFRRQSLHAGLLGLVNPVFYYLVLFKAYELLPAQVAQPINYTWAITLALLSVPVLGHRFTRVDGVATAIAYGGVVVISLGGSQSGTPVTVTGVLLALFSTLLWAGYWLMKAKDTADPVVALLHSFILALPVTGLIFYFLDSQPNWHWASLLSGIYVGLFEMGITFVFWILALKKASRASVVSNLIFISPFLSLVFIYFILGEHISYLTLVGLVLIVSALVVQSRFQSH